jgi:hypothetical protein
LRNILRAAINPAGLLLLICFLCGRTLFADDRPDVVMRYYLEGVDSMLSSNYIFVSDESFSCRVTSILTITDYRGVTDKADTAVFKIYYSDGDRDSSIVIDSAGHKDNVLPEGFMPPNLWSDNLHYYFFPNDTGAGRLAVGFDKLDGAKVDNPVGFINLNRNNFQPESIFLHYPHGGESRRRSENYFFEIQNGIIRLKTYEKISVEIRFLGRHYTHRKLEIDNYLYQ